MISLTLLARANEEKARKTIALDILRSESARQLQELWNSSNSFVSIKSETLSAMAGMELNTLQPIERRFTIALVSDGNPLDRVLRAAPMLSQLENSMSALVAEPTRFDLHVYKDAPEAVNDLVGKKIDFIQLNPREFLRARERDPAVKALIRLIPTTGHNESAVIFTRTNSGIEKLGDLRGRSILLGAANSTLSFWTKASLVTEGVQGTDLAKYRYIDRRADILGDGKSGPAPALGNPYSVMTPVEAVVAGLYDAGVVREKRFQEVAREQGLVALHRFNDSSDLLVAGGSLSADQVGAFCRVILAESETAPGEALLEAPARFRATTEDDFIGLLAHLGAEKAFAR
jgi:hypothetical protein